MDVSQLYHTGDTSFGLWVQVLCDRVEALRREQEAAAKARKS